MKKFAMAIAVTATLVFGAASFVVGSEAGWDNGGCNGEWCAPQPGGGSGVLCCPQGACPQNGQEGCLNS